MSDDGLGLPGRAAALRAAFDRSFAEPLPLEPPPLHALLAIRVGTGPFALRLSELAGIYAERHITPLPGRVPALLGIAGFRGAIVPVYDLSLLFGDRSAEATPWLAMAARAPIAFAFASQEGQFRVGPEAIVSHQSDGSTHRYIREFVRLPDPIGPGLSGPNLMGPDPMRPVIDLSSIIDSVRRQLTPDLKPDPDPR